MTPETRERLRSQANQLGEPEVLRLIDLLAVAVEDVRQGGDPRLPLELALVKVTRPGADLSRESLSYRIEQLESRAREANEPRTERADEPPAPTPPPAPRDLDLEQLERVATGRRAGRRGPLHSRVVGSRGGEPAALEGERLVVEFPPAASFHRNLAEEPKNAELLGEVLYEVTGRRLAVDFVLSEGPREPAEETPATEEEIISLMKSTFDAREVHEE